MPTHPWQYPIVLLSIPYCPRLWTKTVEIWVNNEGYFYLFLCGEEGDQIEIVKAE